MSKNRKNMTKMHFNIDVVFIEKDKAVTCILKANNLEHKATKKYEEQAEGISAEIRAKQRALIRCMAQFNGRVCTMIENKNKGGE